ncbi:uncharacterized protein LOC115877631 [Sitophilus oryzae]|uniref:Gustatory receptor n=1 Tax=Sitophilus oryzae TaxID=7048 RepID=A0A6J2XG88_SITOR|nr:uncharacterized protein LOC115877631 [Sitophilus oryzae]
MDFLPNTLMWSHAVMRITCTYTRRKSYEELLKELAYIEKLQELKNDIQMEKAIYKKMLKYFVCLNIFLVAIWLWYYAPPNFKLSARYYWGIGLYFIQEILFYYYSVCFCFITVTVLVICHERFKVLNYMLWKIKFSKTYEDVELSINIQEINNIFKKLKNVTEGINDLFGSQFLLQSLLSFAWCLHICLYLKHASKDYSESVDYPYVTVMFISIIMGSTLVILVMCDKIRTEAKKLMTTAYYIEDCLSIYSKPYTELQAFMKKVSSTKFEFTAAGFFTIHRHVMFSILGNVATYFILLEQFWTTK